MFRPGQSGNPKGRPLGTRDEVGSAIRADKKAPKRLISNLRRLQKSKDENVSLKATIAEIEFGWGKASQAVQLTDGDGQPITFTLVNYANPNPA